MLNKVKIGMLVGVVLTVVKAFLPDLDVPSGLEDAVILVIMFVTQFFVRETEETVKGLTLNMNR